MKSERQHHDRRMERIRQRRKKRRIRTAMVTFEIIILLLMVAMIYQMERDGGFQIVDISGIEALEVDITEEAIPEIDVDTQEEETVILESDDVKEE